MQKEEYVESKYSINVANVEYMPVKSSVESDYSVKVESCSSGGSSGMYPISSKTFWVAVVCIGLGVYLVVEGYKEEGLQLILLGLGLLGVRDAIRKVEKG